MKITFFKIPKHRVFNYKPVYYDAEKEELDERVRKIEDEIKQQNTSGEYVFKRENINFKKSSKTNKKRREVKLPNKRLFVYVAILLFVVAMLVFVRNFAYLINSENYKSKQRTENKTGLEEYDWNPEAVQIVIVDDDEDEEVPENISKEEVKLPSNRTLFDYAAIFLFVVAIFAFFLYQKSLKSKQKIENKTGLEKYDWNPETTQIVIVDDDDEISENTSEE